jgi:uroporphyrinogen-III decarboxylase
VGDKIELMQISGTDFGTQRCEFISPDLFREFYKPYHKKINDWVHNNTNWKTFYHTCGSVVNLLDDFVDSGMDIMNPVQCSATGMEPKFLKEKYGGKLTFWGGGIDTQNTLPFGTPEEVKAEALERLKIFAPGGGFVFNTIHNIQQPTPVENILAMFEAIKEYNKMLEKK